MDEVLNMDELLEMIRYLILGLSVMLAAYFYHAKHVVKGMSTKRAYLSKAKKRILLLSEWDQPSKLDVLFRAICITPYILLLAVFYLSGALYMILDVSGIHNKILAVIVYIISFLTHLHFFIGLPLFYLIKFLIRKKI